MSEEAMIELREEGWMTTLDDLLIEISRDDSLPRIDADWFEWAEGVKGQINTAMAAEGVEAPYAYAEWLKVAALAYKRAQAFAEAHPEVFGRIE